MGGATTSGVILARSDSRDEVLGKVKAYAEAHPEKKYRACSSPIIS